MRSGWHILVQTQAARPTRKKKILLIREEYIDMEKKKITYRLQRQVEYTLSDDECVYKNDMGDIVDKSRIR